MFDTRKGEALLAVIEGGSFEQAAQDLNLTPSAISQRISALEGELGTPLLVRSKPCRATPAGQKLLQYLRRSCMLEQEFMADMAAGTSAPLTLTLAANHDSLATWLLPALADFLMAEQILLDIRLDDQDHTFALLAQGLALAAIASDATPMRGCSALPLGIMRYLLLATPAFAARWFPSGLQREAARVAPLMVFDRKDDLQAVFLQRELGLPAGCTPTHFIPSSDAFVQAIRLGLGYGLVPQLQAQTLLASGELLDLVPGKSVDVALFWHTWRVQSPRMERLSAQLLLAAGQMLLPLAAADQAPAGGPR